MPTTARRRTLRVYIHTYVLGLVACLLTVFHHIKLARTYMHNRDCYIQDTHTQHSSNSRPVVTKSARAHHKPRKDTQHTQREVQYTPKTERYTSCARLRFSSCPQSMPAKFGQQRSPAGWTGGRAGQQVHLSRQLRGRGTAHKNRTRV